MYWLNTVTGMGQPIPRPVWGTWHDDHLMLSVGSVTHWHNIVDGGREKVSVHLPSDTEVVILQGRATVVDNPSVLGPFCEAYNAKYQWIFEPTTTEPVVQLDPDKVIAWTTLPAEQCTPEMDFPDTAARWTFH